jgi:hypothetical protein
MLPAVAGDANGNLPALCFDTRGSADISASIRENGGKFLSVTGYGITAADYTYNAGTVTVKKEFLEKLAAGAHYFGVNLDNGTAVLQITVLRETGGTPLPPGNGNTGANPFLTAGLAAMGGFILIGGGAGLAVLLIARKKKTLE